jgi:hypothetical protein
MIPGRTLHRLAEFLSSPEFCRHVVEPLLADFQHEWRHVSGLSRRARALASGYGAFWCSLGIHALNVWMSEMAGLTWRDAVPFPVAYILLIVATEFAATWAHTGTIWHGPIDTRVLWATVPLVFVQRWIPATGSLRSLAVYMTIAIPAAKVLLSVQELRPLLRGWVPLMLYVVAVILVQPKNRCAKASVIEPPH